jgi:hypothetical protein
VLHDTTCRTWAARHVLRIVVQIAPFVAAIIILVPGPLWLRVMCSLGGAIMGMIFAVAYVHETAEHRLVKAGYAPGTGIATRAERTRAERARAVEKRESRRRAAASPGGG